MTALETVAVTFGSLPVLAVCVVLALLWWRMRMWREKYHELRIVAMYERHENDRLRRQLEEARLANAELPPVPGGPLRCWRCGENHQPPVPCIHRLGDR